MNKKVLFTIAPMVLVVCAITGCNGGGGGGGSDPQPTPEKTLTKIVVTPTMDKYNVGMQFTKNSIGSFQAYYSDGSTVSVKEGYTSNPTLPYTFVDGDVTKGKDFTFTYQGKSASFHVNVIDTTPEYTKYLDFTIDSGTNVSVKKKASGTLPNEVTIPSTVDGKYVTSGTAGTTYTVTIVGGGAFQNCTSLTGVNLPNSITEIYGDAFKGCSSLGSIVIPNSVEYINDGAFSACSSLSSVTFASGSQVKEIGGGDAVFDGCTSLTSITLPDSLETIGDFCFSGSGIKSFHIPAKVTFIGGSAFVKDETYDLESLTFEDKVNTWNEGTFNPNDDGATNAGKYNSNSGPEMTKDEE